MPLGYKALRLDGFDSLRFEIEVIKPGTVVIIAFFLQPVGIITLSPGMMEGRKINQQGGHGFLGHALHVERLSEVPVDVVPDSARQAVKGLSPHIGFRQIETLTGPCLLYTS